ncbi:hypothetical protein LCGC14_1505410 [marine sediment metagenome]|uniref:Uncharacterized protein n=1 Tax=marine sediment metagenome TaxID=412755 RepID=A0A0F9J2W3_9ZZZZ
MSGDARAVAAGSVGYDPATRRQRACGGLRREPRHRSWRTCNARPQRRSRNPERIQCRSGWGSPSQGNWDVSFGTRSPVDEFAVPRSWESPNIAVVGLGCAAPSAQACRCDGKQGTQKIRRDRVRGGARSSPRLRWRLHPRPQQTDSEDVSEFLPGCEEIGGPNSRLALHTCSANNRSSSGCGLADQGALSQLTCSSVGPQRRRKGNEKPDVADCCASPV